VEELKSKVKLFEYKPTKEMSATDKSSFLKTHGIKILKAPVDFQPIVDFEETPFSGRDLDIKKCSSVITELRIGNNNILTNNQQMTSNRSSLRTDSKSQRQFRYNTLSS